MEVKSESEAAQSCPTLSRPHGLQPTRLLCPWDFPGKSTGVGCRSQMVQLGEKRENEREEVQLEDLGEVFMSIYYIFLTTFPEGLKFSK